VGRLFYARSQRRRDTIAKTVRVGRDVNATSCEELAMLVFNCPSCGGKLQMPENLAGKKVRCATCQGVITAPLSDGPAEGITADAPPSKAAERTAVRAPENSRPARRSADDDDNDDRSRRGPRRDEPAKKGGNSTGAIVAVVAVLVVGCLVCGVGGTVMALMFPAILGVRDSAARAQAQNNMKQIALAAHNHHDMSRTLPTPKHLKPPQGTLPVDLSWRVSILPFVEQGNLFNQFDQTSAWDSPRNAPLENTIVPVYQDLTRVAGKPNPATPFQYFTGPGTLWPDNSKRPLTSITDGTSNTFLFAEAAGAVPWPKPADMPMQPGAAPPLPQDKFFVAMVDGSVRLVDRRRVSDATLVLYINPADGVIPPPLD
jgi:hypothetical protein